MQQLLSVFMTLKEIILIYSSLMVTFVGSFVWVFLVCDIMYVLAC